MNVSQLPLPICKLSEDVDLEGELLIFASVQNGAKAFPRTHLVYAQTATALVEFRFPLVLVGANLGAGEDSNRLMVEILNGKVSVLYESDSCVAPDSPPPAHFCCVKKIEFNTSNLSE